MAGITKLERAKRRFEDARTEFNEAHKEYRKAILRPWCRKCKHIVGFNCWCSPNYDGDQPSGYEPKEVA